MTIRKKRLIELMKSFDGQPKTTEEIKTQYNKKYWRWGFGSNNELAQFMAKSIEFENREQIEWHKSGKIRKNYAGWVLRD
jgi:hypothetical protein